MTFDRLDVITITITFIFIFIFLVRSRVVKDAFGYLRNEQLNLPFYLIYLKGEVLQYVFFGLCLCHRFQLGFLIYNDLDLDTHKLYMAKKTFNENG